MSWRLEIISPDGNSVAVVTQADSGISGGFKWQRRGSGDCVQLEFSAIPTLTPIPPRSIVTLDVGGTRQFWGVAADPPAALSKNIEQVRVLGGSELFRAALMDARVYEDMGIYDIVRDIASRLLPNRITGSNIAGGAGPTLSVFYSPYSPLYDVLGNLAKSANCVWGVDATGTLFFAPTGTSSTSITEQRGWRYLHTQDREVCTKAVLRVASAPNENGATGQSSLVGGNFVSYLPATISETVESPEHATYGATRVFEVPKDVSVTMNRGYSSTGQMSGVSESSGVWSNSGQRWWVVFNWARADVAHAVSDDLGEPLPLAFGARVTYRYDVVDTTGTKDTGIRLTFGNTFGATAPEDSTSTSISLPPTSGADSSVTVILPPNGRITREWQYSHVSFLHARDVDHTAEIKSVEFLTVNRRAARDVARSLLRTPYASPAEVEVSGLLSPTPQVSALGQTADALIWDYEHTPEHPTTTRIRFGAGGQNPTARAIRFARKGEL